MSSISSVLRARTTPSSASTASTTASSPAIDAVCERAATPPTSLHPTFIITTGLRARRAACSAATRPSPSLMPSEYSAITLVRGSSTSRRTTSPSEMSASLPVMTMLDRPISAACAAMTRWPPYAPDWLTMLTPPARTGPRAMLEAKLPTKPVWMLTRPSAFGPSRRMPVRRATASSSSWRAMPSPPTSAKPALKRMAARVPRSPRAVTTSSTCGAGTATMAMSGTSGRSATLG
ncbi:hypothetical protein D9M69_439200 [compost metagenome]